MSPRMQEASGNMYGWVTHMHTHLGGVCPHHCEYCYVQRNWRGISPKYKGELRLEELELTVNYGKDNVIFIEHMADLFADKVRDEWIRQILAHCTKYPENTYIFQTKNPARVLNYLDAMPDKYMLGTTIETDNSGLLRKYSLAPPIEQRIKGMLWFRDKSHRQTFLTIEPIMKFDVSLLSGIVFALRPLFVNIGADSKKTNLPEPNKAEVQELIDSIDFKFDVRLKDNINRILGGT